MSKAATPGAENNQKPVTPANAEQVTVSKEEFERLSREAARAAEAQSRADRIEAAQQRQEKHFKGAPAPKNPPSAEEREAIGMEEDRKAERGLIGLALEPKYREILDADATLRTLFTQNPLGVLPVLAPKAFDAEDALTLVRQELDKRVADKKASLPEAKPAQPVDAPKVPPSGGVNPSDTAVDAEYEDARKLPGTEQAVVGMIKAGLKRLGAGK